MKDNLFNDKMNKANRIKSLLWGLVVIGMSSFLFHCIYYSSLENNKLIILSMLTALFAIGIMLTIIPFNIKNKTTQLILVFISGVFITLIIYNEVLLVGFGLLLCVILLIFIYLFIIEFFTSIITFFLGGICFIFLSFIPMKMFPQIDYLIGYIFVVLYIIIYKLLGQRMNKYIISNILGFKKIQYDEEYLQQHMNCIYLLIFILLNLNIFFVNPDDEWIMFGTFLNNSFITGIAIINIKWSKIFPAIFGGRQ